MGVSSFITLNVENCQMKIIMIPIDDHDHYDDNHHLCLHYAANWWRRTYTYNITLDGSCKWHMHKYMQTKSHTHAAHAHAHAHTHTRKRCEIAIPHRFNRGGNLAINFLTFLTSVFRSTHRRPLSLSLSHIRTQTNICCWLVSLPRCRLLEAK